MITAYLPVLFFDLHSNYVHNESVTLNVSTMKSNCEYSLYNICNIQLTQPDSSRLNQCPGANTWIPPPSFLVLLLPNQRPQSSPRGLRCPHPPKKTQRGEDSRDGGKSHRVRRPKHASQRWVLIAFHIGIGRTNPREPMEGLGWDSFRWTDC